jgi:hypothetical protein
MRGDMEISKVAEFLILMVVLAIGIGLVTLYTQNSKAFLGETANGNYNTSMVQAKSFSDSQIRLYLKSCESMVQGKMDEDFTCYILEGDMGSVNLKNLTESSQKIPRDVSRFNTNNAIAEIKYNSALKRIIIVN